MDWRNFLQVTEAEAAVFESLRTKSFDAAISSPSSALLRFLPALLRYSLCELGTPRTTAGSGLHAIVTSIAASSTIFNILSTDLSHIAEMLSSLLKEDPKALPATFLDFEYADDDVGRIVIITRELLRLHEEVNLAQFRFLICITIFSANFRFLYLFDHLMTSFCNERHQTPQHRASLHKLITPNICFHTSAPSSLVWLGLVPTADCGRTERHCPCDAGCGCAAGPSSRPAARLCCALQRARTAC